MKTLCAIAIFIRHVATGLSRSSCCSSTSVSWVLWLTTFNDADGVRYAGQKILPKLLINDLIRKSICYLMHTRVRCGQSDGQPLGIPSWDFLAQDGGHLCSLRVFETITDHVGILIWRLSRIILKMSAIF